MARFADMTLALVRQRAGAAHEFLQVAEERIELIRADSGESAEAQVAASNAINAGISACYAICGKTLGQRANDGDHRLAVDLLGSVKPSGAQLAMRLRRLLADKSELQYGGYCSAAVARSMTKEARKLVEAMADFGIS
ncbi:hypothetical protein [Subtercola lobariae]|uniref:HEPN domain-containing protein n=1 Tax=Subtercola lobariae TaxID=1588641 RepID=A0A917AZJ7_9MICO|nr:hypothetical protein [Subtercola lobariae]GGF12289.1 hypothetical protein GCM10011399_02790 [Subtercola lobariae]